MSVQKLKSYGKQITGVEPLDVSWDEKLAQWIMYFKDKVPVYIAYIEHYKCDKNIYIGYSENLKCWYIMNH